MPRSLPMRHPKRHLYWQVKEKTRGRVKGVEVGFSEPIWMHRDGGYRINGDPINGLQPHGIPHLLPFISIGEITH